MKKNYLHEHQSKGKSIVSRRWKLDVRDVVNNYDFGFIDAHAKGGKCELCGNSLTYVAVIGGNHLHESNNYKKYSVGFDCLQLVFGRDWNDYRKAKYAIDQLKKEAARQRRIVDYAVRYDDIIDWLNEWSEYVESNWFLRSMKDVLLSGSKVFTVNMEGSVRTQMEKSVYSADEYTKKLKHHKEHVLPRLKLLYDLVCRVDKITPGTLTEFNDKSNYAFVNSVYYKAKKYNKISPSQLEWMNKLYDRYTEREQNVVVDTSDIPF